MPGPEGVKFSYLLARFITAHSNEAWFRLQKETKPEEYAEHKAHFDEVARELNEFVDNLTSKADK